MKRKLFKKSVPRGVRRGLRRFNFPTERDAWPVGASSKWGWKRASNLYFKPQKRFEGGLSGSFSRNLSRIRKPYKPRKTGLPALKMNAMNILAGKLPLDIARKIVRYSHR